jgi:hypothetical protein
MKPIKFETINNRGIFEYHFYPRNEELIIGIEEEFSFNNILWENWCKKEELPESFKKFNISNFSSGSNILLYMLFIWQLRKGKKLYGAGIWETDMIRLTLDQKPELINWEYKLEHELIVLDNYIKLDKGFEKAVSPVITQYNKSINQTPIDKVGLFTLDSFNEVVNLIKPGLSDASNLTNFYAINNIGLLLTPLTSISQPSLESILEETDIFIALLIGSDPGYFDYLLIKSKMDISDRLNDTAERLNDFARYYIHGIKLIETPEMMIQLIEDGLKKYSLL